MKNAFFSWDHRGGKGPWGSSNKRPGGNNTGGGRQQRPQDNQQDVDEMIRQAQERLGRFMGGGGGGPVGGGSGGGLSKKGWTFIFMVIAILWLASGFYIVKPDEQGVVMTFGKYTRTTGPGPNYHLPWPIETVEKPQVTRENIVQVGFRAQVPLSRISNFDVSQNNNIVDVPAESLMLTGDENIVDLNFTVRWRIDDAQNYLFEVENPVSTVKNVSESVMREVIGQHPIDAALTDNKGQIQNEAREKIQDLLNSYKSGVLITGVELQQVNPPQQVIDAFRDVQAAKADKETMINEAQGYANDRIPRARGEVAKIIQAAEAYRSSKVSDAEGQAARFNSQLAEYTKAKEVTARRLYLETMEEVLGNSRKVIMSGEAGRGVLPYLPLNETRKQQTNR